MAAVLRARVAQMRAERETLENARNKIVDRGIEQSLQHENESLVQDLNNSDRDIHSSQTKIQEQREFVTSIPSETQLLKLERRLESVKASLADADRSAAQLNTGIDAYRERSKACASARKDLLDCLESASKGVWEDVASQADSEGASKTATVIVSAIDDLIQICEDRESTLLDLNQRYAAKIEEDSKLSERIANLQSLVEAELPRIESEADRFVHEITVAWSKEKEALQLAYEKLYAVNKEQQYHLLRGTHVKREVPGSPAGHDMALSARHARLSAQLIDARSRLSELIAENTYAKRTADQLRSEGRDSAQRFESLKQEVADRLRLAHDERAAAETESRRFRNLKSDLQDALQAIRETPSGATKTA